MRMSVAVAVACLILVGLSGADESQAAIKKHTNIPAEDLGLALQTLAKDRGFQLVYESNEVKSLRTQGASGDLTPQEALTQILKGTGLTYRYLNDNGVSIVQINDAPTPNTSGAGPATPSVQPPTSTDGDTKTEEGKKGFLDRFRLAQVDQGTSSSSSSVEKTDQASQKKPEQLEEVIVTAQKKQERLEDVPIPISVINTQQLTQNDQILLRDYIDTVPGLNLTPGIQNQQTPSIRGIGIGAGAGNPSVAIVIDDVPFGGTTGWTGDVVPDIDPGDLARIEVLRGPQGTLYGAASLGGLLRYVTTDPSTDAAAGTVEAGTSGVTNGAEPGYNFRASANVPVNDTLAFRISGYERQDPGYIDNATLNIKGINEAQAYGSHFAALWRPDSDFSVKLSALFQDIRADAPSEVNTGPGLGQWDQNYIAGAGKYDKTIQAYSAVIKGKLGAIDVTSLTGYNKVQANDALDFSADLPQTLPVFGVSGSLIRTLHLTERWTQELRLSGTLWQRFDWMVGGFYTHEKDDAIQRITATNPVSGQDVGIFLYNPYLATYGESAGFLNGTYRITDRLDVQIGSRESRISQGFDEYQTGLNSYPYAAGPLPYYYPQQQFDTSAYTYSASPQFKLSPDLMVYARAASGYRAGGFNNISPGIPQQYYPDKTEEYAIGIKGDLLNRYLSIDADVYRINWKNIQVTLNDPVTFTGYETNAGEAKSEGIELSLRSAPLSGLSLSGWISYDHAVMTQAFPSASPYDPAASVGDRLPYVSRVSGYVSAEQSFHVINEVTPFVGGSLSYVGDREGQFQSVSAPARLELPGYAKIDLHAGIHEASWTVNLFANNVANRRALLTGGQDYFPSTAFVYIQPRAIGVNVLKTF